LVGATLVDTYDNAIRKGYIRAVVMYDVLFLSNMLNHDFSMNGNSNDNIPMVKSIVLDAIKNFVKEKNIKSVATGKGKPIKDLSPDEEDQITEDWKKKLATAALAASTMFGTPDVQSAPALTRPETTAVSQVKQLYTVEDVIAATIVDEAGGEKNAYEGMQAVLNVIMNRVNGDVRKAAIQCLKPYQFSGWNKVNKKDSDSIKKYIDSKKNHARFKIALDLVNQAKSGSLKDITSGANHFLNVQLTKQQRSGGKLPSWYNKDKVVADIGRHQFLKLQEMHELS
jgi:1,2-phenylacetyl-CoA epoxidase PaaB subunit